MNLPVVWQNFVREINTPAAYKYLTRVGSGWVNKGPWPKVEELTFAENRAVVTRVDGNRIYFETMDIRKPPPAQWHPYQVHAFTVVNQEGRTFFPDPPGVAILFPVLADGPRWVDLSNVEGI
jgi:hypothetical protein